MNPAILTLLKHTCLFTTIYLFISKTPLQRFALLIISFLSLVYFGPVILAKVFILLVSSYLLTKKFTRLPSTIGIFTFIIIFVQLYIVLGLLIGTQTSQQIVYFLEVIIIFCLRQEITKNTFAQLTYRLSALNVFEIFILCLTFILGSHPQSSWDANFANLYNAKWYFLNNSFGYLPESISSLFPQNGIGYYTFFYGIGQEKALQISYFLPLVLLVLFFQSVSSSSTFRLAVALLLYTPLMVFESSNGYYDLIITNCCLFAFYLILKRHFLVISFLIGFAAGIKFFPLALGFVPIAFIFFQKDKISFKIKTVFLSTVLLLSSTIIWGARSYLTTGSPTFPFFQNIFPTPQLWSPADRLENNYMIQTTMSVKEWLLGGFVTYPFKTYTNSGEFMEAGPGYTTRAPIIFCSLSLGLVCFSIYRLVKTKKIGVLNLVLILLHLSLIFIGIFTRYYRYLWPYQSTIIFLTTYFLFSQTKPKKIFNFFFVILLLLNFKNITNQLNFSPIEPNKILKPNYYQLTTGSTDPILFINQHHQTNKPILDASNHPLHRFHLNQRIFECNWYWIMGQEEIKKDPTLSQFEYVILSTNQSPNYCLPFITPNRLTKVFENQDYLIFKP